MYSGTHTQQQTVINNIIQAFLLGKVPMKQGKWLGFMASRSKIRDIRLMIIK